MPDEPPVHLERVAPSIEEQRQAALRLFEKLTGRKATPAEVEELNARVSQANKSQSDTSQANTSQTGSIPDSASQAMAQDPLLKSSAVRNQQQPRE
jgi:hypothetical protein